MIAYAVIFGYRDHGYDKFMPMNNFLVLYCPNQVNQPLYFINIHGYNEQFMMVPRISYNRARIYIKR